MQGKERERQCVKSSLPERQRRSPHFSDIEAIYGSDCQNPNSDSVDRIARAWFAVQCTLPSEAAAAAATSHRVCLGFCRRFWATLTADWQTENWCSTNRTGTYTHRQPRRTGIGWQCACAWNQGNKRKWEKSAWCWYCCCCCCCCVGA